MLDYRAAPDTLAPAVAPVAKAVALVESGIFDCYLVVERDGVCTVAGGTRAVVALDGDQLRVRCHGSESHRSWLVRPLVRLGETLTELPVSGCTAYGWVAFELAYLLAGRRDLAGNGTLAQLIVPRAEVWIGPQGTVIDCVNPVLRERIELVLDAVLSVPEPRPVETAMVWRGEAYSRAVADAVWEINRSSLKKVTLSASVVVENKVDLPRTYLAGRPDSSFLVDMGGLRAMGSCPRTEPHDSWAEFESGFPAVAASGIPRAAACDYIARSERGRRGLYGGAIIRAGWDGSVEARTVLGVLTGGRELRAGAGVDAKSTGCAQVRERLREVAPYHVTTVS